MPLTDSRLLGNCGRLKCCLLYEFSTYEELRVAAAPGEHALPGLLRRRRLHDGQGPVDPRAQAERRRRLPRRHGGRGAARSAHVGGPGAHHIRRPALRSRERSRLLPHDADLLHQRAAPTWGTRTRRSSPTRWRATGGCAGDDVWFLTGTDEHGDKIAQAAAKAGVSPQALADENSAAFRDGLAAARHQQRRLHPDHGAPPHAGRPADPPAAVGRRRDLLRQVRRPLLLRLRALLHREGDRRRQVPRPPDARSRGSRRRTTSSGCRSTRAG